MPTYHDDTKVLLGSVGSSDHDVTCENADPATFKAGLVVRRSSTGGLQLADDSTAVRIGVSRGTSLSDSKKTAVVRSGNFVPIKLKDEGVAASLVVGGLTFEAKEDGASGNDISITLADSATAGAETVTVTGTDIVVGIESTVSTAAQIKAAVDGSAEASALVSVTIASGQDAVAQSAAALDNLAGGVDPYSYVTKGAVVKTDDTTGEASSDGDDSSAIYVSGPLTGVYPDGSTVGAAYIDMAGGL